MYLVTTNFVDLEDGNYKYKVGDEYPRKGAKATEERIAHLLQGNNKAGLKLIKEVKAEKPKKAKPKKKSPNGGKKASK